MSTNNNNKRDIKDRDENNNKKIKLDNNNNTTNTSVHALVGVIDITNLSKQTIPQLKLIAKDYKLKIKGNIKKDELIQQITSVHNIKQEILSKQEYSENINSFNKGIFEFKIKDGICDGEWSFWKIFRNKFIYKRIMSNMNKSVSHDYDTIISVTNMVINNKIGMLRDKVINGKYLVFTVSINEGINDFIEIFKSIRNDNDEDRLFYHHLFKNYHKHFLAFIPKEEVKKIKVEKVEKVNEGNSSNGSDYLERLIMDIITLKCLPALQTLNKDYQLKDNSSNIITNSIFYDSFKFFKLFDTTTIIDAEFISNLTLPFSKHQNPVDNEIEILNFMHCEKITNIFSNDHQILNKFILKSHTNFNETILLKSLIKICKLILSNEITTETTNQIVTLQEIETFSNGLTKQELKLQLSDNSFQNQEKKQFICKLLDLFYSVYGNELKPESFNLYFGDEEHFERIFDKLYSSDDKSNEKKINLMEYYRAIRLFSTWDKDKQIKFIDSIINYLKLVDETLYIPIGEFRSEVFINHLVENDDLELLDYFITKLDKPPLNPKPFLVDPINSTKVLDYIFHHRYFYLLDDNVFQFKNIQLLKYYETLVKNKHIEYTGDVIANISKLSYPSSNELLSYIIESGPLLYNIEPDPSKDCAQSIITRSIYDLIYQCGVISQELLKTYFYNYQFVSSSKTKFDYSQVKPMKDLSQHSHYNQLYLAKRNCHSSIEFLKFLEWLYMNHRGHLVTFRKNYPNSNVIDESIPPTIDPYLLLRIGRFDEIPVETDFIPELLDNTNETRMNVKLLDFILNNLENYQTSKDSEYRNYRIFYEKVLRHSAKHGKLWAFEFIFQNYGWILSIKNTRSKSPSFYNKKELKELLFTSLVNSRLELSEFLFQILPKLTKLEFESYSSQLSRSFFKNKSF